MRKVLKWDVAVDDRPHPIGHGMVLHVACQDTPAIVQVWTMERSTPPSSFRRIQAFGTGQPLPEDAGDHVGTVCCDSASLVWHLFTMP